jgi:hypothetical protein
MTSYFPTPQIGEFFNKQTNKQTNKQNSPNYRVLAKFGDASINAMPHPKKLSMRKIHNKTTTHFKMLLPSLVAAAKIKTSQKKNQLVSDLHQQIEKRSFGGKKVKTHTHKRP